MVNEKGAQYWAYSFKFNLPEDHPDWDAIRKVLVIYAFSEEEARAKFKQLFKIEAGELMARDPW